MNRKIIFLIMVVALLLPLCLFAQNKPKIKSVDITLELPKPGSSRWDAQEMKLKSAVTEYGDLNASGDIQVMEIAWDGEFKEDDDGGMFFKDGFEYKLTVKFLVDYTKGRYGTDYVFKNGEYYIDGSRIKVTINGKPANVRKSAPYVITVDTVFDIGLGDKDSDRERAKSIITDYILNKDSYKATLKPYSIEEANANSPLTNPKDLIIIDNVNKELLGANERDHDKMLVSKIIIDTDNEKVYKEYAASLAYSLYNVKEVWISDKVDATAFYVSIVTSIKGALDYNNDVYIPYFTNNFSTQRGTLFIPEAAADGIKKRMSSPTWKRKQMFAIKTYTGNVYEAQKAGAEAAKPFCTNHVYTSKIVAADRRVNYYTCKEHNRLYYSCKICGKCEHNDKHTFVQEKGELTHVLELPLADDQAYIGINAAGHHVWRYSCIWCKKALSYMIESQRIEYDKSVLRSSKALPGFFILPKKSTAKMNREYQSSVNYALCDNLLDEELLGNDYTKPVTQMQLRSLAVRLAEELIGKEIKIDKKQQGLYNNTYMAKAASMGILNENLASLPDNRTATREEVATVIYNTLRYIEKCRVYSYTEYDSRLDKYEDAGTIAPWAKEAMAFMEALELVKGASGSSLAPKGVFSIEQAIDVAEKSIYAHQLGWYQCRNWGETSPNNYPVNPTYYIDYQLMPTSSTVYATVAPGERIWVIGPRLGTMSNFLPVREPVTGQTLYMKAGFFRPVRKYVFSSERTTLKEGKFKNYDEGIFLWHKW